MKIVDNRIVKPVLFGDICIGEVFRPMDIDVYPAIAYMRIQRIEDDSEDYFIAVDLDEGYLTWFDKSEQVELLNVTLHINQKGEQK